jgi:Zn-dependent peptidase ImmA (M78 family)/transcriptional regulator with XRE-family HTH domain
MVLGRILKQVRENRQFELEDVASFVKISASRLQQFEEGGVEPSFVQVQKLADAYGLPSYILASRALPNLPEALPDFRRTTPRPARLSPSGMRRIWSSEKIATFTHQLASEIGYPKPEWKKNVPTGEPTVARATKLREYFDEWVAKRNKNLDFKGTAEQTFFGSFRLFLEVQGTVVNVNDAPPDDFLGFYIDHEESAPVAFVNRKISSRKAQLFTLAHEYAHQLAGKEGVSNPFVVRNSVERTCNQFAAEFLAPMAAFRSTVEQQSQTVRSDPFDLIRTVSKRLLLSQHATAIRLVEGDYLSQTLLRAWETARSRSPSAEKEEEADAAGDMFGAVHAKRIGELGYLPTYLAKLAVDQKMIDRLDVHSGLGLSESLQESAFSLASRRVTAAVSE